MPTRTICIPVAEVIEGGTKSEFYADLRKTLDLSVRMANISATECLRQDDLSQDECGKIYTYPALRNISSGVSFAAASIARAVEKHYMKNRFQVRTARKASQTFRSQPWPLLHNKSRRTLHLTDEGEFLLARVRLLGGWWTVRLAGGSSYRDQTRGLRKAIESGTYGDSKIWVDRKHKAIVGVSCDIPTTDRGWIKGGVLSVSSSRDSLLVATLERSTVPFVINADVVKQWHSEADRRYQRLRQDRKSDANRRKIRREFNAVASKMNRRMNTFCHDVSARVVNKAVRTGVAEIKLDLTVKSYAKHFPWFDLAGKIKYKAESAGIRVLDATQSVLEPEVGKPHVYFKFAQIAQRIKIGMTAREDGSRHGTETDSPEELVILAIDNQPKAKLRAREKHFHAMFQEHRVVGEWFLAEPILAWLREVDWLGNAGNLSQIAQVLDLSQDWSSAGHLQADSVCLLDACTDRCSHNAESGGDIAGKSAAAPAVNEIVFRS